MKIRRAVTLLMCVLLFTLLLPVQVLAADVFDAEKAVSMTITYGYAGVPLSGAEFDLYLIAERMDADKLTVTEDFRTYPVDWSNQDFTLAETLKAYVARDALSPFLSGEIDENGVLSFSTLEDGLKQGRYLLIAQNYDTETDVYKSHPVIFDLPGKLDENQWVYEVVLNSKPQKYPKEDGREPITRKVLKVWDDEGYEHMRAVEVVIQLLRNGEVFDTVILNDDNNWRHTWTELDSSYEWSVVEDELELHTVKIEKKGITFVVTNSYGAPPVVTPTPTPVVTPSTSPDVTPTPTPVVTPSTSPDVTPTPTPVVTPSTSPDVTPTPTPVVTPSTSPDVTPTPTPVVTPSTSPDVTPTPTPKVTPKPVPTLPQTGQLWWPVPILLGLGLVLVVVGIILRRGNDEDE